MPYIDQERVVRELTEACDEMDVRFLKGRTVKETIDTVKNHINAMPAADVVPVVKGHWMQTPHCFMGKRCYECSKCYSDQFWNKYRITEKYPRCPNCGANMDGGAM